MGCHYEAVAGSMSAACSPSATAATRASNFDESSELLLAMSLEGEAGLLLQLQ
jgi:hypothetical protein